MTGAKQNAYRLASLAIFAGVLMMCQPFSAVVFSYGFPVLLAGVIGFILLDHLPGEESG